MQKHKGIWQQLAEYVADGEPEASNYAYLKEHLHTCVMCKAQLARLRIVESALRSYPMLKPRPELAWEILRAIRAERREKDWHLVPWNIWLPGLTMLLAISIIAVALPGHTQISLPTIQPVATPIPQSTGQAIQVGEWLTLNSQRDALWPLWAGLLAVLSGCGLALSISSWGTSTNKQFDRIESHVADATQRFRRGTSWNR